MTRFTDENVRRILDGWPQAVQGLTEGFCDALLREDDWSFVIKLHAVLEAAVTNILVEKTGYRSLQGVFSRIDMGQEGEGKLAFAKALGLLASEERRYIKQLSELRNQLSGHGAPVGC